MPSDIPKHQVVDEWMRPQPESDRSLDLSIVIPAFNEQWRLPTTLIDIIDYLGHRTITYEVIVVNDGSTDDTVECVRKFERIRPFIRLIHLPKNCGKGHAVRTGILNCYGKRILFMDADGATSIREIERLEAALENGADLAIGSRTVFSQDTKVTTHFHRKYLGRIFNLFVNAFVVPQIADTQCGFKMFRAPVAQFLFERQRSDGFGFDVEVLLIAQRAGLRIAEVAINWTNVPGSKVNLIFDALKMAGEAIISRFRHRAVRPFSFEQFLVESAR